MTNLMSIKSLFSLNSSSHKTYDISTEFQISKIHKQETKNLTHGELYTLTLSDPEYSYSRFIYCKTPGSPDLQVGKYINITKICPMILEAHKEKAFLVKELIILPKHSLINIKSPPYNEKSGSSGDSSSNGNITNSTLNNNYTNMTNSNNNSNQNDQINKSQDSEFMSYNTYKDGTEEDFGMNNNSYTPLKQLTTLTQNYKLLVKVITKGEIKPFRSGKGKLFSFIIMDESGTKMQVVGFDKLVDKFKDEIRENEVYEITGGYLRNSDKRYDPTDSDYKLILNENSAIVKKSKEEIETLKYKFCDPETKFSNLKEVKDASLNSIVNVLCIVGDKGESVYKDTKGGSLLIRKTIVLDQSNEKMELTLWRNFTQLNINNGDLLVLKKVRVNDFGGKNLTSTSDTKITINPPPTAFPEISKEIQSLKIFSEQNELNKGIVDNPLSSNEYKEKKKFIENNFVHNNSNSQNNNNSFNNSNNNLSNYGTGNTSSKKDTYNDKIVYIDSILDEMGKYIMTDFDHRFPFYKIRAIVTHLGHTDKNFYPGCPNRECNRKVTLSNGDWICQSCRQSFKVPKYYYSLNIRVKDCSSEYWVDIFGKPAEMLMNMTADDYRNILISRDDEKLDQITDSIEYKEFYFLLKVRLNRFNDSTKKKFTANKIERVIKKNDTLRLIGDIKAKLGMD